MRRQIEIYFLLIVIPLLVMTGYLLITYGPGAVPQIFLSSETKLTLTTGMLLKGLAVGAFSGLFLMFIFISIISRYSRRMQEIVEGTTRLARGELNYRFPEKGKNDELEMLAHRFNEMAEALELSYNRLLESEKRYRDLYDYAPVGYVTIDNTGKIIDVNKKSIQMFNLEKQELIGRTFSSLLKVDKSVAEKIERQLIRRKTMHLERLQVNSNGSQPVYVSLTTSAQEDETGQVSTVRLIMQNITREVLYEIREQKLKTSLEKLTQLFDLRTVLKEICHIVGKMFEYKLAWIGIIKSGEERVYPVAVYGANERFLQYIAAGVDILADEENLITIAVREKKIILSDLSQDRFFSASSPSFVIENYKKLAVIPLIAGDRVLGVLNVFSEREDAFNEQEKGLLTTLGAYAALALKNAHFVWQLRETGHRYQQLVQHSPLGICLCRGGKILMCNSALSRITGYPEAELIGKEFSYILHPDEWIIGMHYVNNPDKERTYKLTGRHQNGDLIYLEARMAQISVFRENATLVMLEDVTERRNLENKLQDSELTYRTLVENSIDGVFMIQDWKYKMVNQSFALMFGYKQEEIIDKMNPLDFVAPEDRNLVARKIEQLNSGEITVLHNLRGGLRKDGTRIKCEVLASRIIFRGRPAIIGSIRDITRQQEMESRLQTAMRLEAIGTLAGGIAHDFNNLITGIMGSVALLMDSITPDSPYYVDIKNIELAAGRAAELTKRLLTFSRQLPTQPHLLDLNQVLDETMGLLCYSMPKNIKLEVEKEPRIWTILADPAQIQQLIINLCSNARDAIPADKPGKITIQTKNVIIDKRRSMEIGDAYEGKFVELAVTDTGVGMTAEQKERIFDPFYTTKGVGKGIGLGLSIVYGIVKSHKGFIDVESDLNQGSVFKVYLPVCTETPREIMTNNLEVTGKGETILIVDDDKLVRDVTREILESNGYKTLTAASGEEAIRILQSLPIEHGTEKIEQIELVILDVVMPEMSGVKCYAYFRQIKPEIKVIFSTGHNFSEVSNEFNTIEHPRIIFKPFRAIDLLTIVRETLDGSYQDTVQVTTDL